MKNITLKIVFIALAFFCSGSFAQLYIDPNLTQDEKHIFKIVGFNNQEFSKYILDTQIYVIYKEHLRRAGMLARCEKLISKNINNIEFNADLQDTLQKIIKMKNEGLILRTSSSIFKWQNRAALWSMHNLQQSAKINFFNIFNDSGQQKAHSNILIMIALEKYENITVDVNSGEIDLVAPHKLYKYFIETNQLDFFKKILLIANLNEKEDLEIISNINLISKNRINGKSKTIAEKFLKNSTILPTLFFLSLNQTEKNAIHKFLSNDYFETFEFVKNAVYPGMLGYMIEDDKADGILNSFLSLRLLIESIDTTLKPAKSIPLVSSQDVLDAASAARQSASEAALNASKAANASSITKNDDSQRISLKPVLSTKVFIKERVDNAYPAPEGYEDYLFQMTPAKMVANEHLKVCPAK